MSDLRTAAQQALEALEYTQNLDIPHFEEHLNALAALRAALAEPEQQPVAWCNCEPTLCDGVGRCRWQAMNYTHPPRREWRGLTDEAVIELLHSCDWRGMHLAVLVRAIEQALKEKNA